MNFRVVLWMWILLSMPICSVSQDHQQSTSASLDDMVAKLSGCRRFDIKHQEFCSQLTQVPFDYMQSLRDIHFEVSPQRQRNRENYEIPQDLDRFLYSSQLSIGQISQLYETIIRVGADRAMQVALRYHQPCHVVRQDGQKVHPYIYAQRCMNTHSSIDHEWRRQARNRIIRMLEQYYHA